ncbi:DUF4097 family beta strand repeat-containing protein [Thermophagus xiamenensis]|uniref:Putative adhesin n=1 Tax=Thermophagus xiamenensis TaxID=385682 RepID=A0A1I2BHG0_9BACT|nr:DUF4097 family beta strand repeat-containing protein [Thermophagus xiamenensis]SFE55377.1 Putative adhesin [Thermophagus xiamenensis]
MKTFFTLTFLLGWISLAMANLPLEEVYNATKTFNKTDTVKIEGDFCKIILQPSTDNAITVSTVIKSSAAVEGFGLSDQQENNTLNLSIVVPDKHVSTKSGEMIVSLPTESKVWVKTGSGYIQPQNLQNCTLNASASYGKIIAENVSGNFNLKTLTGAISVNALKGQLAVNTKSGPIEITNIDGEVTAITDKGDITVENVKGKISVQTNTAAQNLSNINGELNLRTSTGLLTLKNLEGKLQTNNDDGDVWIENLKGYMDLKSLSGKLIGKAIELTKSSSFETTKGRIEMELKNDLKELTFELESNYGFLYIPGKAKKKKLTSGKGPIVITGFTNSGPQRFTLAQ